VQEADIVGDNLHKLINMGLHWCVVFSHCYQSDTVWVSSDQLCLLARHKSQITGNSSGAEHLLQ